MPKKPSRTAAPVWADGVAVWAPEHWAEMKDATKAKPSTDTPDTVQDWLVDLRADITDLTQMVTDLQSRVAQLESDGNR